MIISLVEVDMDRGQDDSDEICPLIACHHIHWDITRNKQITNSSRCLDFRIIKEEAGTVLGQA